MNTAGLCEGKSVGWGGAAAREGVLKEKSEGEKEVEVEEGYLRQCLERIER